MSGILGALFGASDPAVPAPDDDFWYGGSGTQSETGLTVTPERAMRVTTVYRCIAIMSQTLASLPIHIYRKIPGEAGASQRELADNHPLGEVLRYQPNRWQTSFEFRQMLMGHLCLRGNAYAEIVPGVRGAVDQLIPLHPDRVVPERLPTGSIRYTVTDPFTGQSRRLLQDEIMHLRGLTSDGLRGLAPIEAAANAVGLALATEKYGSRLFRNATRPSGILTTSKGLNEAGRKRLKQEWAALSAGMDNTGRTAVLEDGLAWQKIGLDQEEAQYLETRGFQVEEIARLFGVPLFLLASMTKNSTWGAGIEQMLIAFVIFTMQPWLVAWEQVFRRDLLVAKETYEIKFNVDGLLRGDSKARAEFYASGIQNLWMNPNEVRRKEGMNDREGGDAFVNPNIATMGHNGGPVMSPDTIDSGDDA